MRQLRRIGLAPPFFAHLWNQEPFSNSSNAGNPPATAKHRIFSFVSKEVLPDDSLVNIASRDAFALGPLCSRIHVSRALAAGGTLEDRPRYIHSLCFNTFPFPAVSPATKERIRGFAESLDARRKRQQEQHPSLTMTDMYNVLEKLRSGEPLTKKEQTTHEQGLVSVLQQIHDDLDAAVFDAYGWPTSLSDEEILERLVALNAERAALAAVATVSSVVIAATADSLRVSPVSQSSP